LIPPKDHLFHSRQTQKNKKTKLAHAEELTKPHSGRSIIDKSLCRAKEKKRQKSQLSAIHLSIHLEYAATCLQFAIVDWVKLPAVFSAAKLLIV
jgi:hypothetical protein